MEQPDNVIEMPFTDTFLTDQDIVNLFMGLVRLMRKQYEARIEMLESKLNASNN